MTVGWASAGAAKSREQPIPQLANDYTVTRTAVIPLISTQAVTPVGQLVDSPGSLRMGHDLKQFQALTGRLQFINRG